MKPVMVAAAVLCGMMAASHGLDADTSPMTVRILTYNIHHGEGMDGVFDLQRLADIISSTQPDLVAIQEVDEATRRSGGVDQLEELARLTGLHPTFGRAMEFQDGGYGVGVLSRWPAISVENQPLPTVPDREPRTALTVVVEPGPQRPPIAFTSTHFDSGRGTELRTKQAAALNDLVASPGHSAALRILAGDLNSGPDTEAVSTLRTRWIDVSGNDKPTLSASGRLSYSVDWVLVQSPSPWRVVESRIVDAPIASDHRPVFVVLERVPDSAADHGAQSATEDHPAKAGSHIPN
jgi:endonuclease/exonuclease/phosphatase family metal-dependent hydrolase